MSGLSAITSRSAQCPRQMPRLEPNGRQPGYGALNDWRIENGRADFVDCGTLRAFTFRFIFRIRMLVTDTSVDGFVGGFVDWVDKSGQRPASWQRFIDTSGYMLVATEEIKFNNEVDWSL